MMRRMEDDDVDRMQARTGKSYLAKVLAPGDQTAPERHFQQVILPSRGDALLRAAERLSRRRARRAAPQQLADS